MVQRRTYEKISVKKEDVISYLQPNGNFTKKLRAKEIPKDLESQIDQLLHIANDFMSPKGIFQLFSVNDLPKRECFAETQQVALAIVTIGVKLPSEVNRLMSEGKYVDGVIFDAIGSAGVEKVADLVNLEITKIAEKQDLSFSSRYSPGYCQWSVNDQRIFFSHLPADDIGVTLSDGYMMQPIKSVSFAINLGTNIKKSKWETRCKNCEDRGQCTYRLS